MRHFRTSIALAHLLASGHSDECEQESESAVTNVPEYSQDWAEYHISTDKNKLDLEMVHDYLSHQSYWAQGRSYDAVRNSVKNSLCFGVYRGDEQVGLARVVTDYATFAWLCDVFILASHGGKGLGKWLIQCVVAHPSLKDLKLFILATRDAHELYRRYGGFDSLQMAEKWMVRSLQTGTDAASHDPPVSNGQ